MYLCKSAFIQLSLLYSGRAVVFRKQWLYSGKSGCIRAKVVILGVKWFYLDKNGSIRPKLLYSGKVVVFRQNWLYSGKNG